MCLTKTNSKWQMSKISEESKYIYNITWSHHEKHVYVHGYMIYKCKFIYILCMYCILYYMNTIYIIEYVSK